MKRLIGTLALILALAACKNEFTATIYIGDVKAIATGEAERIGTRATIRVEVLSREGCVEFATAFSDLIKSSFAGAGEPRCEEAGYSAFLRVDAEVPIFRVASGEEAKPQEGSAVAFAVYNRESDKRTAVAVVLDKPALDRLQRGLQERMFQAVPLDQTKVRIVVNNDLRQTANVRAFSAFVDGRATPNAVEFEVDPRASLEIDLSDVATAYVFDSGKMAVVSFAGLSPI